MTFQQRRRPLYRHDFADLSDLEHEIDLGALVYLKLDSFLDQLAKPGDFSRESVAAGVQLGDQIIPRSIRMNGAADAGGLIGCRHLRSGHDRSRAVLHGSNEIGGRYLRVQVNRSRQIK